MIHRLRLSLLHFGKYREKFWIASFFGISLIVIFSIIMMIFLLGKISLPAWKEFGISFIFSKNWDPIDEKFGALPFIYGTLTTSLFALLVALPFGIGSALFLTFYCPKHLRLSLTLLMELLSAIPSIVFGMWGVFFVAPFVRDQLAPFLSTYLGFIPLFKGPSFGVGIFTAILILALMITPIIMSLCRELFSDIDPIYKEAALSLGATPYEAVKVVYIRPHLGEIFSISGLALARALGEAMAVVMVIGNTPQILFSLFSPGATLSSILANEYGDASGVLHLSSLGAIAICLFLLTMIINILSRVVLKKFKESKK